MKRIIELDIVNKDDLLEKYNKKQASRDLINYIVESISYIDKKDEVKIILNNHFKDINSKELILEGLKREYHKSLVKYIHNNIVQIIYLILGVVMIFLSTIIKESILSEVVLIGGFVFIWAMIEMEIFTDVMDRRKRKRLKKLLRSEIIEKNNE